MFRTRRADAISAFEGTHPVHRQSPPSAVFLHEGRFEAQVGRAGCGHQASRAAADGDQIAVAYPESWLIWGSIVIAHGISWPISSPVRGKFPRMEPWLDAETGSKVPGQGRALVPSKRARITPLAELDPESYFVLSSVLAFCRFAKASAESAGSRDAT